MKIKGKIALITGASAGIGLGFAEVFAEAGADLILVARRKDKLDKISEEIENRHGIHCYKAKCDVRNYDEVKKFYNGLPERWKKIDILVNNAGLARGLNYLHEGVLQDWEEMIDTNVKGLLYVSRVVLPDMVKRGRGDVLNIASVAGREVYPKGNVYCATKHAAKALSKGMIIDLNGTGVRVTNIDPGLVETEFSKVRFHGDDEKAEKVYEGYTPLTGRDIAEVGLFAVERPPHVSLHDILVMPTDQATATMVNKKNG